MPENIKKAKTVFSKAFGYVGESGAMGGTEMVKSRLSINENVKRARMPWE
jgi:hypothetical protein